MRYKKESGGYLLNLDIGDEVVSSLTDFAVQVGIKGATFDGIGAIEQSDIGYFDIGTKIYIRKKILQSRELLSIKGNIGLGPDGKHIIHAHVALAGPDFICEGGHLFAARVSITAEIRVLITADLHRTHNERTGLMLWKI